MDLNPSARLKVKGDTFFLPDPDGSVYFRNNTGSFRMEGKAIDKWIEKLIPAFNGEHTIADITNGLSVPYRERVYEIAEVLYKNGFIRDVSQDRPHQLTDAVMKKYGSQIEFLDSFGGSGAYRFQKYRQSKVLAAGSGPFLVSLIRALLESGLPALHILDTGREPADRQRIMELIAFARRTDPEVEVHEAVLQKERGIVWREAVQPFDAVMYVSSESDVGELRALHAVCREEKKLLLPAVCLRQAGMAGPLVFPESEGCWESALRRVHLSTFTRDPQSNAFSSTAEAMLANVIAFEWFKTATDDASLTTKNRFYLLDPETLEGSWHSFLPHPLVTERPGAKWIHDFELFLEQSPDNREADGWMNFFSRLTSKESGIFHIWEEGDLNQLPLSLCRVQPADPLSEGPAGLLPEIVCSGLTHEEARREAGLAGIEAYVGRMADLLISEIAMERETGDLAESKFSDYIGVGAGETLAEGVCRGLHKCLSDILRKQLEVQKPVVTIVQPDQVEDERSSYYWRALSAMHSEPVIGLGEEVIGFPVVWIRSNGCWYASSGLNRTIALRKALQQALMKEQNNLTRHMKQPLGISSVILDEKQERNISFPEWNEGEYLGAIQSALPVLKRNHIRLAVFDLAVEPFLQEGLAGTVGVSLRSGETYSGGTLSSALCQEGFR
ncbi:putative thiazole-containing bacteriocin maturation protein [Paenibacillus tarimensis]